MGPVSDDEWKTLEWEVMDLFSPGAPIDEDELFAGRKPQLAKIIEAVFQRGQHAIVYGERGVGKTSLAKTFSIKLIGPTRSLSATIVNCDPSDDYNSLWRKVFRDLQLNDRNLADLYTGNITPDDVRRELSNFSLNTLPIIILDEFDKLNDATARALVANTIKTLSDHSVRATIVLVGVARSVTDLVHDHESIVRALLQVHMPRMGMAELAEIIDKRLPRVGMTMSDSVKFDITALSRGLPHYTHLLGQVAARRAIQEHSLTINEEHLEQAQRDSLERVDQTTRETYHRATHSARSSNIYKEVLLACALAEVDELGFFPARAVQAPLTLVMGKPYDTAMFGQHLKILCGQDRGAILEQTGTPRRFRYRFVEPLMQPYIIMRGIASGLITRQNLTDLVPNYEQPKLSTDF